MSEENDTTETEEVQADKVKEGHVRLGKREILLRSPRAASTAFDILVLEEHNVPRARAAALWACWGSRMQTRPKFTLAKANGSMSTVGGAVFDDLVSRGISIADIMDAGKAAMVLVGQKIEGCSKQEVDEARDF